MNANPVLFQKGREPLAQNFAGKFVPWKCPRAEQIDGDAELRQRGRNFDAEDACANNDRIAPPCALGADALHATPYRPPFANDAHPRACEDKTDSADAPGTSIGRGAMPVASKSLSYPIVSP